MIELSFGSFASALFRHYKNKKSLLQKGMLLVLLKIIYDTKNTNSLPINYLESYVSDANKSRTSAIFNCKLSLIKDFNEAWQKENSLEHLEEISNAITKHLIPLYDPSELEPLLCTLTFIIEKSSIVEYFSDINNYASVDKLALFLAHIMKFTVSVADNEWNKNGDITELQDLRNGKKLSYQLIKNKNDDELNCIKNTALLTAGDLYDEHIYIEMLRKVDASIEVVNKKEERTELFENLDKAIAFFDSNCNAAMVSWCYELKARLYSQDGDNTGNAISSLLYWLSEQTVC